VVSVHSRTEGLIKQQKATLLRSNGAELKINEKLCRMFKFLWDQTLHFRNECECLIGRIFECGEQGYWHLTRSGR
jgi:hypothetical protein